MSSHKRRMAMALGAGGAAVTVLFALVFLGTSRPPEIPGDWDHVSARTEKDCLRCHGPDGDHVRRPNHPLRDDCFSCHVWTKETR
jgi:hypothetical protein